MISNKFTKATVTTYHRRPDRYFSYEDGTSNASLFAIFPIKMDPSYSYAKRRHNFSTGYCRFLHRNYVNRSVLFPLGLRSWPQIEQKPLARRWSSTKVLDRIRTWEPFERWYLRPTLFCLPFTRSAYLLFRNWTAYWVALSRYGWTVSIETSERTLHIYKGTSEVFKGFLLGWYIWSIVMNRIEENEILQEYVCIEC